MKRQMALVAVLLVLVVSGGCATLDKLWPDDPQAQLTLAADAYATVLNTAVSLYEAEMIDRDVLEDIAKASIVARAALDSWRLTLDDERDPAEAHARFEKALADMQTLLDAAIKEDEGE